MSINYPSPLRLIHETAPWIALSVARTGRFRAGPILGDAGLNAVIEKHPNGPFHPDQAGETPLEDGAELPPPDQLDLLAPDALEFPRLGDEAGGPKLPAKRRRTP